MKVPKHEKAGEKCCESRCEMSGENGGILGKQGEGLARRSPCLMR